MCALLHLHQKALILCSKVFPRKNYLWRISKQVFILLCGQAYRGKDVRQQAPLVHTQRRTRRRYSTCMSEGGWRILKDDNRMRGVSGEQETGREWKAYGEWLMCGGEQPHEWTNVPINNLGKLKRQEEITRDLAEQACIGQWQLFCSFTAIGPAQPISKLCSSTYVGSTDGK